MSALLPKADIDRRERHVRFASESRHRKTPLAPRNFGEWEAEDMFTPSLPSA
jgi:hypothetical protein